VTDLTPPASLDGTSRRIWTDTVQAILQAGTIARVDPNSLAAYVSAVRTHQRATALLAQTDILTERDGKPVPNPALAVQAQAAQVIAQFARQFRLTASHAGPPPAPGTETTPATEAIDADEPSTPARQHLGTWCALHARWECASPKTRGRGPCHKLAEPPDGRCGFHGGKDFKLKNLAAKLEREPTYGAPVRVTAEQALVQRLWARAGHVKWLGERVAELEAATLTWGTDRVVEKWWGEFPGAETVRRAGPHVLLELYDRESRGLEALAARVVELGLATRLVDSAREQGAAMGQFMDLVLHDLRLEPWQWELVPEVLPRRFRELAAGGGAG
jgi:P27 family predicted phage terminase small subunit